MRRMSGVLIVVVLGIVWTLRASPVRADAGNAMPAGPRFVRGGMGRSIVFVCDASKPVGDGFLRLQCKLMDAIDRMFHCQGCDVLFFGGSGFTTCNGGLLAATPENKIVARQLIQSIEPGGERDPLPAIAAAFSEEPDYVYVLLAGDWKGRDQLAACIRQLNGEHKVKVSFVVVAGKDATDEFRKFLKSIADENGGTVRTIEAEKEGEATPRPAK